MTDTSAVLPPFTTALAGILAQAGDVAQAGQEAATAAGVSGWLLVFAILLIVGVPFLLGWGIAKALRYPEASTRFSLVILAIFIGITPFAWNVVAGARQGLGVKESLAESIKLGVDLAGGTNLVYQIEESPEKPLNSQILDNMVAAVAQRANPSGTEEVTVRRVGSISNAQIEVIVPGADPEKVRLIKDRITRLGSLEFALLANDVDHQTLITAARALPGTERDVRQGGRIVASWRDVARTAEGEWKQVQNPRSAVRYVNRRREILPQPPEQASDDVDLQVLVIVEPEDRRVTGEYLTSTHRTRSETGQPAVGFNFNARGGRLFYSLTSSNLPNTANDFRRSLAILLDNEVHSAPSINEPISDSGIISGDFTQQEVTDLLRVLDAGALEVPINPEPISEYSISPLLGSDTIQRSIRAMLIAGISTLVVVAGYYLLAGLVANFCLMLNLLLLLGVMSFIDATFTLPGLAGIVLAIAMAVDANVLIFERMREEFERGASMRLAIQNGFDRAFSAIFDSNVTTLITSVILFVIGTDAVKGFAVSLFVGIVVSLFTALYVGRLVFDVIERKRWVRQLKMNRLFAHPNIDFLGHKKPVIIATLLLAVLGSGMLYARGSKMLDIDFLGGTMVTFQLDDPSTVEIVRATLEEEPAFKGNVSVERLNLIGEEVGDSGHRFRVRTTLGSGETEDEIAEETVAQTTANETAAEGSAAESSDSHADQLSAARMIAQVLDEAGMSIRRVTFELGEITPIEGEEAEGSFAGGSQAEITFGETADGERQELSTETVLNLLARKLAAIESGGQSKYDRAIELIRVIGTAGSGMEAAENEIKTFSSMRIEASPIIEQDDFQTALSTMQSEMRDSPVFDEVNSFDSSVAGATQRRALMAILLSWVAMVGFLWFRFQDVNFGLAAVIGLIHDVVVTLGLLALASYLGGPLGITFLGLEEFKINLPMVAAILTLIGYSVNDTIVVFDRIREIRGKNPTLTAAIVNTSLNSTLSRTLLTSVTTLIACVILYFMGGAGIHGFMFILTLGIIIGTYSTIYIACPLLLWLVNRRQQRQPAVTQRSRQPVTT